MKHRVNAFVVLCCLLLCVAPASPALSSGVVDSVSAYEQGLLLYQFEEYSEALECFSSIPNYKDSRKWALFCQALLNVESGDIDAARTLLIPLAELEFENADQWKIYCDARDAQANALYYQARSLYKSISVGDSIDRYLQMHARIMGEYDGPDDDAPPPAPPKPEISARVTAHISVYSGPGSNYKKLPFKLDTTDEIVVYESTRSGSSSWYMIGVTYKNQRYRVWASTSRISPEKSVPWTSVKESKRRVAADIKPYYGPGEDYAQHNFTVKKGALITVYDEECGYYMAEAVVDGKDDLVRAWYPASAIQ